MSDLRRAWAAFKASGDAFVQALEAAVLAVTVEADDARPTKPLSPRAPAKASPLRPSVAIPTPIPPARKAAPELSAETYASSLPLVTALADKCIRLLGDPNHPHLRSAVQGGAALERIPVDEAVITAGIAAAKGGA